MMESEEKSVDFRTKMNIMDDAVVKESADSRTCLERCLMMENEVHTLKNELKLLNGRFEILQVEKLAIEEELMVLRKKNEELQERLVSQCGMTNGLIDLNDEKSELADLMIENKVLECEKKKAESEVEVWKKKCKELEGLLVESREKLLLPEMVKKEITEATKLEDGLTRSISFHTENKIEHGEEKIDAGSGMNSTRFYCDKGNEILESSVTPIPSFNTLVDREGPGILSDNKLEYGSRVRKQLFKEAGNPNKKMSPSTPAGVRPASICVIDIVDSDCESETKLPKAESTMRKKMKRTEQGDEEDVDNYKGRSPMTVTPKRKRASNIITSGSERDDDDNDDIPICKFISQPPEELDLDSHLSSFPAKKDEEDITKRCKRLRKCEIKYESQRSSPSPSKPRTRLRKRELEDELKRSSFCPSELKTSKNECLANENEDDDDNDEDMGGDGSESEGDSLGGFIVESSDERGSVDDSDGGDESVSDGAADDESDGNSEGNLDIGEIMSKIRRKRNQKNLKWEFEADMLASFGKDPEMCMKAVCALYRQQTADEKSCKGAIHCNKRGFSQCDSSRGTKLAEFLTDGDPKGDLVKSVEQLEAYNRRGIEQCRKLATHYSKQLFEIYQNKEDPFFLTS